MLNETYELRNKFNGILKERLHEDLDHLIMSIEVESVDFNMCGSLNSAGKKVFWKEVNRAMRKLDEDQIGLKPRKPKGQQETPATKSLKLPPPPPKRRSDDKREKMHYSSSHRPNSERRSSSRAHSRSRSVDDHRRESRHAHRTHSRNGSTRHY